MLQVRVDPDFGARVVDVVHRPSGVHWLRQPPPDEMDRPMLYGMPILLPPGRIWQGRFELEGHRFSWPINDHAGPSHIHGFVHDIPWDVTAADARSVRLSPRGTAWAEAMGSPAELETAYRLDPEDTLDIVVRLTNRGAWSIPAAVGWHTNVDLRSTDYRLVCPRWQAWELNGALIPTGRLGEAEGPTTRLASTLVLDQAFRVVDGASADVTLVMTAAPYRVHLSGDDAFRQWVLYRPAMDAPFISVEPYSWVSNAPNLPLDPKTTGLQVLRPGETQTWRYQIRFAPATES